MVLKVTFCLLLFYILGNGTECSPNMENLAVYEGDNVSIMNLTADPNTVKWSIVPTSDEFGSYQITDYGGYRDPSLESLFYPNQSGLAILKAVSTPTADPMSTSGLYIAQCQGSDNRTAAKLVVVRSGPDCSCVPNTTNSTNVQLSCTVAYADYTVNPIPAVMTWMVNGAEFTTDQPYMNKTDYVAFTVTSTITVDGSTLNNYECIQTFGQPMDVQYDYIASNAPDYSQSCSSPVCGSGTGQIATSDGSSTTPCSTGLENIALFEGDLNTVMSFPASPNAVKWSTTPTTDELSPYTLVNNDDTVDPNYAPDYAYSPSSGLTIKNATTTAVAPHQLATAGLYAVECGGNTFNAKVLVVRQGPTCSCLKLDDTSIQLTCTSIYADSSFDPIAAIFTLFVNGNEIVSDEPTRTKYDANTYISSTTFTADYGDTSTYECVQTFGQPTETQDPNLAVNAPTYSRSCSVSAVGQNSNGLLIRKPTNTAAVAGSSNITFECASTFGTNTTDWFFTPFGAFNNETIQVSEGYQLLKNMEKNYELQVTVTSTVLIVRQMSIATEGRYIIRDGLESASALLLSTPFPISVETSFGPVAGGTTVTITGLLTIIDYISTKLGTYIPVIKGVRNVYFGNDLSSASILVQRNGSSVFGITAVTPSTTEASIGRPLPIIIEFSPTPFNMTFNKAFTYRPNPEITALYPDSFIVDGGTLLEVTARNLSSVAKPIIQLTVFITRDAENGSTTYKTSSRTSRICTFPPKNDTYMLCPMPPLNLPEDFLEILNSQYDVQHNISRSRRKRDIDPDDNCIATVSGQNGIDRADICLGFIFDGYKKYENINDEFPETRFLFYSAPEINSSSEVLQFDPSTEKLIYVKGRNMLRGCRLTDYLVQMGSQVCVNSDLQDNQLSCRPPKEEPSLTANDTNHCNRHLSIRITLGYKPYQYACLTYKNRLTTFALIVGLTVGLSGLAIFLVILIACIINCRRRKSTEEVVEKRQNPVRRHTESQHQNSNAPVTEGVSDEDCINRIYRSQRCQTLYGISMHTGDDDAGSNKDYLSPNTLATEGESDEYYKNRIYRSQRCQTLYGNSMGISCDDETWSNKDYLTPVDEFERGNSMHTSDDETWSNKDYLTPVDEFERGNSMHTSDNDKWPNKDYLTPVDEF